MKMKHFIIVSLPVLLSACVSEWDMAGQDPKDYYKEHPIVNKVETRYESHMVHFTPGTNRLTSDQIDTLMAGLSGIRSMAVESVQVQMHPSQVHNTARRDYITKLLKRQGYSKYTIMFEPSDTTARDDVNVNVAYASVISPRCPDWRTSSVTTYSNTSQAGYGCASVTNLGLMVADPRDLERGTNGGRPDSERNYNALKKYHTNESTESTGSGGSSEGATTATSSTSSASQ